MTQRIGEEAIEDLIGFVEDAIDQILAREDEIEFFAWVRAEAPRRFEEDFARLPGELAVTYLEAGEPQKTLDLAACFTGDEENAFLAFARVIALHRLQRTEEAFAALDDALGDSPYTAFMIATAVPLSIISKTLITLWRSEEELWSRLQKWLEEWEPEEVNGLIGN
jgi:hypothetical protein